MTEITDYRPTSVEEIADWVELMVSISPSTSTSIDRLTSLGQEAFQIPIERLALAMNSLENRARTLGNIYPFESVSNLAFKRREPANFLNSYLTLVLLTPNSMARQIMPNLDVAEMARLFEDLVESSAPFIWGSAGRAIEFGFPSKYGRPQDFDQAIKWLAKKMGLEPGIGYRPPRRKDGGVDVVAWRPFRDGRRGFPVALIQCTIQAEAFTKTTDIDIRLWSTWLAMDEPPSSYLALPGTIRRAGPEWGQLSSVVTVLDRLRLTELIVESGQTVSYEWTELVLEKLSSDLKSLIN